VAQATVTDKQTGAQQQVMYRAQRTTTLLAERVVFTAKNNVDQLLTALQQPAKSLF